MSALQTIDVEICSYVWPASVKGRVALYRETFTRAVSTMLSSLETGNGYTNSVWQHSVVDPLENAAERFRKIGDEMRVLGQTARETDQKLRWTTLSGNIFPEIWNRWEFDVAIAKAAKQELDLNTIEVGVFSGWGVVSLLRGKPVQSL